MPLQMIQDQTGCCSTTVEAPKEEGMLTKWKIDRLMKAQYRPVGHHSAVKICHWCKQTIRGKAKGCYKNTFYGVHADQCLEMSPAITCNKRCLHCWRDTAIFSRGWIGPVDDPKEIIKGCLGERSTLLMGFKGNANVGKDYFEETVLRPDHAAISLTGEPCMYPRLPELVDSFFDDFSFRTVFLVTSGTVPERLREFQNHLPTNLYLSVEAHNKEQYQYLCKPVIPDAWEKFNESLDIMADLKGQTRRILRLTLMQGLNMEAPEKFIPLIEKARPDFVECKSYMHVGYSTLRLERENMAHMEGVREFAKTLSENSTYQPQDEREDSDVVLLKRAV